jgi:hypothetical protein
MATIKYDFAKEFAKNPGLRFKKLSPGTSGEEFREEVLRPIMESDDKIIINVDGIESAMGASFLSEAFGVLAVEYNYDKFKEKISIDTSTPKGKVTNDEMIKRVKEALKKAGKIVA